MRITVNGKSVYVTHERLAYKEIVRLAEMHEVPPAQLRVEYENAVMPQVGVMVPGDIVKSSAKTIFIVSRKLD